MNLREAIYALEAATKNALEAAFSDDKTPLRNALALREESSLVGAGGDNPDVVVLGDLNDFKRLNDEFGHDAGDAAIYEVGKLIQERLAAKCKAHAFRRSGDEFVILLSRRFLEDFKAEAGSFASCSFQFNELTIKTAMSFGYAVRQGEASFTELFAKAEIACQVAKSKGDGACVGWSEEIERDRTDRLRARCAKCGAVIWCDVPQQVVPKNKKLLFCPCCGEPLTGNVPLLQENQS
jgi:diguanylate cyclase (GGDEF)-like protein